MGDEAMVPGALSVSQWDQPFSKKRWINAPDPLRLKTSRRPGPQDVTAGADPSEPRRSSQLFQPFSNHRWYRWSWAPRANTSMRFGPHETAAG